MQTNVNGHLNGIVQFSRYIYYSIKWQGNVLYLAASLTFCRNFYLRTCKCCVSAHVTCTTTPLLYVLIILCMW